MPSLLADQSTLTLHDLTKYFKHFGLVDEECTALMTTLGILQRQNYIIEAMSGNGKTFLSRITLSLFPDDRIYTWGLDTDAAAFEAQAELDKAWVIFITELQKFMGSDSLLKKELIKDLGEDLGTGAKRRRVSGFKEGGTREVEELSISGDKAIVSTLAVENRDYKGDDVELTRRYPTFTLDVSPDHIQHIVDRQLQLEFKPKRLDVLTPDRIAAVKARCQTAFQESLEIDNPVAAAMGPYIPVVDVQTPSYVNHLKEFMKGVTRFYSWRAYDAPNGTVYTTVPDMWELWEIYSDMFWMTVNRVPFLGKRIINALDSVDATGRRSDLSGWVDSGVKKAVTLHDIHRELTRKQLSLPYRTLRPLVYKMCDQCFLEEVEGPSRGSAKRFSLAEEIKPMPPVDWKRVMKDTQALITDVDGREVAKDWRDHQLKDGHMIVKHPVTGQDVKVF